MGFESSWAKTSSVIRNHYGERKVEDKFGGVARTEGTINEAEWTFTYDSLPVASTGPMTLTLPDNIVVLEAYFEPIIAFATGTSYDIDLVTTAGSAIGSGTDKLFDDLLVAEINAIGEWRLASTHTGTHSGDAIGIQITEPSQLLVTATGTFDAGKARIIVRYMKASA